MGHSRWLSLVLLVLLAGCGGKKSGTVEITPPAGGLAALPSPVDIARKASFEDASQVRQGSEYEQTVPTARTTIDFWHPTYLTLNPTTTPSLDPSWVVYSFDLTGYDEEPLIKLVWDEVPLNDSVYLALANWGENHWDFIAVDPVNVTLPDLAPYSDENGRLLLGIIAVGSAKHELHWLAVGDAPPPAPPNIYGVFPTSGQPGGMLTLGYQASGTEPITYSWDFSGGTDPAASSELHPTVELGAEGDYPASLTLTNKYGSKTYDFVVHSVMLDWVHHLVGDGGVNRFVDLDTTWHDNSMVAAEMDDGRVSLFLFDAGGNPQWNRAYTGLPANRVTELMLVDPDYNENEQESQETYMTCYQDNAGVPGSAYLLKLAGDGDVLWYRLLGQGIPDVTGDEDGASASLAMNDGYTLYATFDSNGTEVTATKTVEPASYYHCAGGTGIDGSGTYLAGEVGGKPAVLEMGGWAYQFTFNGKISDIHNCEGGVAVAGRLLSPGLPDTFFIDMKSNGRMYGRLGLRADPCDAVRLSGHNGIVMLTCSALHASEAQVYVLDSNATLYRAVRIEGFQGMLGGDFQYTRPRPALPSDDPEHPPIEPQESLIFCGAAEALDITVSQFTPAEYEFAPSQVDISAEFEPTFLPENEQLTIVPQEVGYTVDGPAGEMDGLYVKMLGIY